MIMFEFAAPYSYNNCTDETVAEQRNNVWTENWMNSAYATSECFILRWFLQLLFGYFLCFRLNEEMVNNFLFCFLASNFCFVSFEWTKLWHIKVICDIYVVHLTCVVFHVDSMWIQDSLFPSLETHEPNRSSEWISPRTPLIYYSSLFNESG